MRFVQLGAVAGGLVVMLATAGSSAAATYTDHLCSLPTGAPSAAGVTTEATPDGEAANTCGQSGGILRVGVAGTGPWKAGAGGVARYSAPEDTTIAAFELARRSSGISTAPTAGPGRLGFRTAGDKEVFEECVAGRGCGADVSGTLNRSGLALSWLELTAGCLGFPGDECQAGSGGTGIRLEVTQAKMTLSDVTAPVVSNVRGTLPEPGAKQGTVSVSFDAGDRGGGLYRLITVVDGVEREVRGLDQGTNTCVDVVPGDADPRQFAARVPCPLALAGLTATIDTTGYADGPHRVQVFLEDAAGNRTAVLSGGDQGTEVFVRNALQNGTGADERAKLDLYFVRNRRDALRGRSGVRYVIRGRLADASGRGIVGARVTLRHLVGGKLRLLKTGVRTREDGRITLILPKNMFGDAKGRRQFEFTYTAFIPGPVTARDTLSMTILDRRGRPVTERRAKRRKK